MQLHFFLACLLIAGSSALAGEINIPPLTGPVVDEVNLLTEPEKTELGNILYRVSQQGGSQIAVLIAKDARGEEIESFAIKVVEAWKLGSAKNDNGLLLLIVPSERKVRIEVGQGLEGEITDALSSRIIRQIIAPAFQQRQYFRGISEACLFILSRTDPDLLKSLGVARNEEDNKDRLPLPIGWLILLLIIGFPLLHLLANIMGPTHGGFGRRSNHWGNSGGWGGGGGGGWGGGGGGGFSGGGGGFSGGGASGGW